MSFLRKRGAADAEPDYQGGTMKTLEMDIETRSGTDLTRAGVYRYTEDPDFDIQLFGYSVDEGPVSVIDLACGEQIPEEILKAITDESVTKWAYNAGFERVCLSAWLRKYRPDLFRGYGLPEDRTVNYLSPASWRCSLVLAAYNGLPLSLAGVGRVLKLTEQKLEAGRDLIRFFACPHGSKEPGGIRTWNHPEDAPEKWALYKAYNRRDVEVELAIRNRLRRFPVPDSVWEEYRLSEEINDRGIALDRDFVNNAVCMDERIRQELEEEMRKLTGLENPNSAQQLKEWLSQQGVEVNTLDKKAVRTLMETAPPELQQVLRLRQQLSRSSVKKYQAMEACVCADGRCRGMFMFYGANRTGRFAGRLVQLQNLPQNHLPDLAEARALVRSGDYETLRRRYDDVPDTLSQLIRTAFVPREGCVFAVADFSSIEARVLALLAGEQWRLDAFARGEDIYCASASQMFGVPVEKHGVNAHLRQKGKIAELALGYGGSTGALKAMGALEMGLAEEELQPLVTQWREANTAITDFWWDVDDAAKECIRMRLQTEVGPIRFAYKNGFLFIRLPSGRRLSYARPRIERNDYGGESITYEGIGSDRKWKRLETYGPKLVENIVQAVSRDLLCHAMRTLSHCRIVAHVHDELIIEVPPAESLEEICRKMAEAPAWLPEADLRADGYLTEWYRKD